MNELDVLYSEKAHILEGFDKQLHEIAFFLQYINQILTIIGNHNLTTHQYYQIILTSINFVENICVGC